MNSFNQLKSVLFQVFNFSTLPQEFLKLLKITNLKIVEVLVGGDIAKIGRDFRCNDFAKTLKYVTNIVSYVIKRNIISNGTLKLKTLVEIILHESLSKYDNIKISSWSSYTLTTEQITCACLDAKQEFGDL